MGFFSDLRKRTEVDDFAKTLAEQFMKRVPLDRRDDPKKVSAEVGVTLAHAQGFQRNAKLGVLGKSRLANTFQWELIELGYPSESARDIGRELAATMAHKVKVGAKTAAKTAAKTPAKVPAKTLSKAAIKTPAKTPSKVPTKVAAKPAVKTKSR